MSPIARMLDFRPSGLRSPGFLLLVGLALSAGLCPAQGRASTGVVQRVRQVATSTRGLWRVASGGPTEPARQNAGPSPSEGGSTLRAPTSIPVTRLGVPFDTMLGLPVSRWPEGQKVAEGRMPMAGTPSSIAGAIGGSSPDFEARMARMLWRFTLPPRSRTQFRTEGPDLELFAHPFRTLVAPRSPGTWDARRALLKRAPPMPMTGSGIFVEGREIKIPARAQSAIPVSSAPETYTNAEAEPVDVLLVLTGPRGGAYRCEGDSTPLDAEAPPPTPGIPVHAWPGGDGLEVFEERQPEEASGLLSISYGDAEIVQYGASDAPPLVHTVRRERPVVALRCYALTLGAGTTYAFTISGAGKGHLELTPATDLPDPAWAEALRKANPDRGDRRRVRVTNATPSAQMCILTVYQLKGSQGPCRVLCSRKGPR